MGWMLLCDIEFLKSSFAMCPRMRSLCGGEALAEQWLSNSPRLVLLPTLYYNQHCFA